MKNKLTGILLGGTLILGTTLAASADQVAQNQNEPVKDVQEPIKAQAPVVQDLSVSDAVVEALENNLDIKVAKETLKVYKANYRANSLRKLGNIKVSNYAYKASDSDGYLIRDYGYDGKYLSSKANAGSFQISIPILDTVMDAEISQTKVQNLNAKRALQKAIEDVTYVTEANYHYLTFYQKQIANDAKYLQEMIEHKKIAEAKAAKKKVSQADPLIADAEIARANSCLAEDRANYQVALAEFKKVLKTDKNFNLTNKLEDFKITDADKQLINMPTDELVKLALNNRQDLKITEGNVSIAKKAVAAATGESLPKFSLVAGNSWNSYTSTGINNFAKDLGFDMDSHYAGQARTIGVNMSICLDAGKMANVSTKEKQVSLAKATLEQKQEAIKAEVKQAKYNLIKALEEIKINTHDLKSYLQANEIMKLNYYKGLCSSNSRIEAQKSLNTSRYKYAYSIAEAKVMIAKLKNLVGNNITIK